MTVRGLALFGATLPLLLVANAAAAGDFCILGFCIPLPIGGPSPHPAPAPMLAAGLPAFGALGGGLLLARAAQRLRRRA